MTDEQRVCPAEHAGMLDNGLRRLLHPGRKILSPCVKPGDFVIDLGCGPGSFTDTLALLTGEEGRVLAVDLQEEMLEAMMAKMKRKGVEQIVSPHHCSRDSLMLEEYEGTADFALAFWMAHETPDVAAFLRQVYSVLDKGGRVLCVEPTIHVSQEIYKEMIEIGTALGFKAEPVKGIFLSRSVLFIK